MVDDFRDKNILIVGLGLMGGSVAKALKGKDHGAVWAADKNPDVIAKAKAEGVIDRGFTDAGDAVGDADFIVVCLYPEIAIDFINDKAESFKSGAVITDICGVKKPLTDGVIIPRDDIDFVPAHPMAGSERQGYSCSFPELFEGCNYILTPLDCNKDESVKFVEDFAYMLGAKKVVKTTPDVHDECIAYTSQIPHVLAVAYMHEAKGRDVTKFAGGSFRDVSRVALINEVMWAELFSQNSESLADEISALRGNLEKFEKLVRSRDLRGMEEYMKHGKAIKESYDAKNKG